MQKIIWASDPHFVAEGDVLGHDPRARLRAFVAHVNAHHSDAQLCILSGDLVDRATAADYAALAQDLSALSVAYVPMVGNHDDREMLRAALTVPANGMPDFVQYAVSVGGFNLLCLDTQKPGEDAGELCSARMTWVHDKLVAAQGQPTCVFMHHPPCDLGLPMQDPSKIENGAAFLNLLGGFECVQYIFFGHVHRPVAGTIRGIPYATMRSILYQAPAPVPAWDWDNFKPAQEAPSLGVLQFGAGQLTLQYEQFCSFGVGTSG